MACCSSPAVASGRESCGAVGSSSSSSSDSEDEENEMRSNGGASLSGSGPSWAEDDRAEDGYGCDSSFVAGHVRGLAGEQYEVGVVDVMELNREWAALDESQGQSELTSGPRQGCHTRYKNIALAIEAAEMSGGHTVECGTFTSLGIRQFHKFHAFVGMVLFFAVNSRIGTCLLLLFADEEVVNRDWSALFFLTLDAGFIIFQTLCVFRDRMLSLQRKQLRRDGAYVALAICYLYNIVVLGLLSGWQILRSVRQLRNPNYRDSFLVELNDPGMLDDSALGMPRYSSHLTFVLELPFVIRIAHRFVKTTVDTTYLVILACWFLCFQLVVFSLLAFDYSISNFIRESYASSRVWKFPVAHYIYRSSECLARFAAISAAVLIEKQFKAAIILFAIGDWLYGFLVLSRADRLSRKGFFLSLPLIGFNLGMYADEHPQLARSARLLTVPLDALRVLEVACAAAIYALIYNPTTWEYPRNIVQVHKPMLLAHFALMLLASLTCIFLRVGSYVGPAPVSLDVLQEPGEANKLRERQRSQKLFGPRLDRNYKVDPDKGLICHLFAKGIGDQFASLMEIWWEKEGEVRLSRLEAVGKLGEGGFGRVYKVQDTRTLTMYALKLQRRDSSATYAVREAEALHSMHHMFIVGLVRIFRTSAFYGILLELCDQDLNRCILGCANSSGLAEGLHDSLVRHYSACMLLALEFLHDRRIVFRDLKPENVLTATDSEGQSHAKLADFGLARSIDVKEDLEEENHFTCADVTANVGTPAFMASEAYNVKVSASSAERALKLLGSRDWYALGCCLMLMLLGERGGRKAATHHRHVLLPPPAANIHAVLRKALDEGTTDADALNLAISLTEEDACERAGAEEIRCNPYMQGAVRNAEALAKRHKPDSRTLCSRPPQSPQAACAAGLA